MKNSNNKLIKSFLLLSTLFLVSCNTNYNFKLGDNVVVEDGKKNDDGNNPFDDFGLFTDPELAIDGVLNDEYLSPQGSGRILVHESATETTYLYLFKGEKAIYFYFDCQDDSISCLNVEDINIVTAQSDSCELYVDTYGAGGKKRSSNVYEFRMTAGGRVFSYLNGFVSRVFLNEGSTLNFHKDVDNGWVIEGYIAYKSLGNDVDKTTPTSFQYARVTKTANRNYEWHGNADPQIPDNYYVLHNDNKLYSLRDLPVTKIISGNILDSSMNPIKNARVNIPALGKSVYTKADGSFELECVDVNKDIEVKFSKSGYLEYTKKISHEQLRLSKDKSFEMGNNVILSSTESTYLSTISGKVFERDGVTPIQNVLVKVNESSALTNSLGEYSFEATFDGYVNSISFEIDNHITYNKEVEFTDINIGSTTQIKDVQLDENYGSEIGFGKYVTGFATARVKREDNSLKMVLKAEGDVSLEGSGFEVFIDTKASGVFNKRDDTDYLFAFGYGENASIDITNYGGKSIRPNGIETSYGRINELYYLEVDLPYSLIDVTKDETIGLYFGVKVNYSWEGMYENGTGNYIKAEAPINYYRLDKNSQFFIGSCNESPDNEDNYISLGSIGNFENRHDLIQYTVSAARTPNYLLIKMSLVDNEASYNDYLTAIHAYVDMNASKDKINLDASSTHIEIYPPRPVSHYMKYDASRGAYSSTFYYEEESEIKYIYYYGNVIYLKLSTELFGGENTNNFGIALGIWNSATNSTSFIRAGGVETNPDNPSTYAIFSPNGQLL